eukprot:TRINITY_DN20915_c0_g1_i1.p1 TRINITY_DN20915_c0_g1~~TRINITY_DN20915_c0_g1_i1.p1  ORF type:complete len:453 (+),score=82.25 TRINITY_DN20915_c0_g1_i1:57-1415(+)
MMVSAPLFRWPLRAKLPAAPACSSVRLGQMGRRVALQTCGGAFWGTASRQMASSSLPPEARYYVPHNGRGRILLKDESDPAGQQRDVSVAVVGASGVMGRQITSTLAANLRRWAGVGSATLQLVGRRSGHSHGLLIGLCSEYRDAYGGACPNIEVVLDLEAVRADVIVMCAGLVTRNYSSAAYESESRQMFEQQAAVLARKNKDSLVLMVANPVEVGLQVFVDAGFDKQRVLGTGAFLQSLRFRREVARELGVARRHLSGLIVGKHGLGMVPAWSTVKLASHVSTPELLETLQRLKEQGVSRLPLQIEGLRATGAKLKELMQTGKVLEAYAEVQEQPPEVRTALHRYLTYFPGPPVARVGNAEAVCQLVSNIIYGTETISSAQVYSSGEFLGIQGIIGAPVIISGRGWRLAPVTLQPLEAEAVLGSFEHSQAMHSQALRRVRKTVSSLDQCL